MPVNPGIEYQKSEREFSEAQNPKDKLNALYKMLSTCPKHKSSEHLQKEIKERIKKYKGLIEKEKQQRKGKSSSLQIKKEGAAQICIVGTTNAGKSTLLAKLTNAKPEIASYPFTTKKPEIGTLDYKGVKIQVIELPSIVKNFVETEKGASFLSIIRFADLTILKYNTEKEKTLILKELKENEIDTKIIIPKGNTEELKDQIWKILNLIKVYTKQPGKEKDFPPVALKKDSTVYDLALIVHKDFIKKFKISDGKRIKIIKPWARVWGKSARFDGQQVGFEHVLEDDDIVELHRK